MMKRIKSVGLWVVILIVIVGLLGISVLLEARRDVESRLAEIRGRGEPVSMSEVFGPPIPDSQNAAVVYDKVSEIMSQPSREQDLKILAEFLTDVRTNSDRSRLNEAKKVFARYEEIIPLVEQAVNRPECRFPLKGKVQPAMIGFANYANLRSTSRVVSAGAAISALDGDMDEAVRQVELGFRVSESLKYEHNLIESLIRTMLVTISGNSLRLVAGNGHIDEAQAKHMYDLLATIDLRAGFRKAALGERAQGIDHYDLMRGKSSAIAETQTAEERSKPPGFARRREKVLSLWLYVDERCYLDFMKVWLGSTRIPYHEFVAKGSLEDQVKTLPKYAVIARMMAPVLIQSNTKITDGIAEINGSRVFLALLAYKDKFGSYPQSLADLRSRLGWGIPEDPFSGKDFLYKRRDKGFLLYSIGKDMKDNGGVSREEASAAQKKAVPTSTPSNTSTKPPYDIVWKMTK